jgi:tetratricopeptide (TPR) repeat protein
MKKLTFIFLLVFLGTLLITAQDKELSEVQQLIDKEKFSEALSLLSKSIRTHASDPLRQAIYINALGDFYRDICGNMKRAVMNYKKIINSRIPDEHPLKQSAKKAIAAIKELETTYREENTRLKILLSRANRKRERDVIEEDISLLNAFIEQNPGYYLLHEAYFALGLNYQALKEPGDVYDALQKAMELKPGVIFYLPVKWRARQAYEAYVRNTVNNATRGAFWVLLVITMVVFYISRPWKWVGVKHIILLLLLVLAWWLIFSVSHGIVGAAFEGSEGRRVVKQEGKDTEYHYASPGSPGSKFSIGMGRFKLKKMGVVFGGVYGVFLFLVFSVLFYMSYCDRMGTFKSGGEGILYYLSGRIHMAPADPEPYILTNPKDYPGLDLDNITDPYLQAWVKKYCPSPHSKKDGR